MLKHAVSSSDAPLQPAVIDKAVEWLVHLWSGTADSQSRADWQRWRQANPEHERAWQHIESVNHRLRDRMQGIHAQSAVVAIGCPASSQRRKALKALSILFCVGSSAWLTTHTSAWQDFNSDMNTRVGERRSFTLIDGTLVDLNTDTSANARYGSNERVVTMLRGEMLITTATDSQSPARPFLAETQAGRIRALGTRFVVRQDGNISHVSVLEGAVELTPANQPTQRMRIDAGYSAGFGPDQFLTPAEPLTTQAAWSEGVLIASRMRLADFLMELNRYRSGYLSCDPSVADLRLSGVFPLDDTDRVLMSLADVLPIRIDSFTRYWTRVLAVSEKSGQKTE